MATLLFSHEPLSREQAFAFMPQSQSHQGEADNPIMRITHWNSAQQARLLANLAAISRDNRGWILIANAPAPLSRRALVEADVNPARVIEVKRASRQLLQQAMACTGIAALVCWQSADLTLPTGSHRRQSVFMVNQHDPLPAASVQARCTPGHFMTGMRPAARQCGSLHAVISAKAGWRNGSFIRD
ncbi:hypothetical protein [Oceanisphaera sp. KMM 10153]|uniref:hypothetical protein n=1 Tax=Oceanisphaera submarina TaxID=3390193 RepID=UPI003975E36E